MGVAELKPAANDTLQRWPVSKPVNSSKADKDDAALIERVGDPHSKAESDDLLALPWTQMHQPSIAAPRARGPLLQEQLLNRYPCASVQPTRLR